MDSQFENTPRHPCDSHFPKGISALSWSFLLENWNKTNVYEMITHYMSCQQCQTVSNSVNSVNSYSAVLPPSPMVFFWPKLLKNYQSLTMTKRRNHRKTKRQQYKNSKRQFTGLESRAPFRNALRKLRRTRNPILSCEWKTVKPLIHSVYHTA